MIWSTIIAAAALLALAGCSKPGETTSRAGLDFANCSGTVEWRESCGKNCRREVQVSGGGRP